MGLDAVEIIMELEDEFQISIEDSDVAEALTVADLYQVILGKVQSSESRTCLSSHAFYRLRRGLCEVTGRRRREFSPTTSLADTLPPEERPEAWPRLATLSGLKLPRLVLPRWLERQVWAATVAALLLGAWIAWQMWGLSGLLFCVLLSWVWLYPVHLGLERLTQPCRTIIPEGAGTLGELAQYLVARGLPTHPHAKRVPETNTPEMVWERVVEAIVTKTHVDRALVVPEARLYKDLQIG